MQREIGLEFIPLGRFALERFTLGRMALGGLAGTGILARKFDRREPCPQEIRLDAHDHASLIESIVRNYGMPKAFGVGRAQGAIGHGIVGYMPEVGILPAPLGHQFQGGRA